MKTDELILAAFPEPYRSGHLSNAECRELRHELGAVGLAEFRDYLAQVLIDAIGDRSEATDAKAGIRDVIRFLDVDSFIVDSRSCGKQLSRDQLREVSRIETECRHHQSVRLELLNPKQAAAVCAWLELAAMWPETALEEEARVSALRFWRRLAAGESV